MKPTVALHLEAQPVSRVWGGTQIAKHLGLNTSEPIGELWLAYDQNRVKSGLFAGQKLAGVLPQLGQGFIGSAPFEQYGLELPLLIKFLDAAEWLSVQVHPDDAYAHRTEAATGFHGKTEAWYILDGRGEIVYGLKETQSRAALEQAAQDGSIWAMLDRQTVEPGRVIYVPAGTIHALGPGLVLYEVQQRSDLTYRIFDYRRGRELHLKKGLDVSKLEPTPIPAVSGEGDVLLASEAFVLGREAGSGKREAKAPEDSFLLLTLIQGKAEWAEGPLGWGDTLLIGAGERVEISGEANFLAASVPSKERLEGYSSHVRVEHLKDYKSY